MYFFVLPSWASLSCWLDSLLLGESEERYSLKLILSKTSVVNIKELQETKSRQEDILILGMESMLGI